MQKTSAPSRSARARVRAHVQRRGAATPSSPAVPRLLLIGERLRAIAEAGGAGKEGSAPAIAPSRAEGGAGPRWFPTGEDGGEVGASKGRR